MSNLTKSNEDYIEAVYRLETENADNNVKSVDIAKSLCVSKPAVNRAINKLRDAGLVEKTNYSDIKLTDKGRKQAKKVYRKHVLLKEFLIKLGVAEEIAEIDSCKIEHIISPETIKCIEEFIDNEN